jgi:hypothetical protein
VAWSDDFIEACDQGTRAPVYVVESLPSSASPSWGVGRSWSACTHAGYGAEPDLAGAPQWTPPTLSVMGWASTMGGFTFRLRRWKDAVETLRRGYVVVMRMGFSGWPVEDFQTVTFGRLRGLRIEGGICHVSVDGPDSMMVSRQSVGENASTLFGSVFATDTVAVNYTTGLTTLTVGSTTGFEAETGGTGVVQVTPNTGDPFYLTYSAKAATTFTVAAADRFGTTRAAANIGNTVREVGYVTGHPMNMIRQVLLSTGAGTNGAWDDLPETWGLGIPEEYVAVGDIAIWKSRYEPGSGPAVDLDWVIDPTATIEQSLAFDRFGIPTASVNTLVYGSPVSGLDLFRTLSPLGIWTTLRQGEITVRAALLGTRYSLSADKTGSIVDDDVSEILSVEPWDSRITHSYRTTRAFDLTDEWTYTRSDSAERHIPTLPELEIDMTRLLHKTGATQDSILALVAEHVGSWAGQIPGVVRLRIKRWKAASLCLGDVISLTLSRAGVEFDEVSGVVTALQIFDGASSSVELTFPEGEVAGAVA